jgi:hypothetical protein
VIISGGCGSRGGRLDPGGGFSSLGDETSICIAIALLSSCTQFPVGIEVLECFYSRGKVN